MTIFQCSPYFHQVNSLVFMDVRAVSYFYTLREWKVEITFRNLLKCLCFDLKCNILVYCRHLSQGIISRIHVQTGLLLRINPNNRYSVSKETVNVFFSRKTQKRVSSSRNQSATYQHVLHKKWKGLYCRKRLRFRKRLLHSFW